jgi:enamine deaminase RidA (YjgF/YER057c/UK114 family)
VRAGNLLFISGTTAGDEQGQLVGPGDIVAQTRYIFQKFGRLLRAAGGGFEHIVETTDYVTTTENYAHTAAVRREFFGDRFPTATGVMAPARGRPDRDLGGGGAARPGLTGPSSPTRRTPWPTPS